MPVKIHNKEYLTVAERVHAFRTDERFDGYAITTEIISAADLVQIKAVILNPEDRVIATGYAEEIRGSTNINKTSALENCETSAIGRALACLGLGGESYASADEVADAIIQQEIEAAKKSAMEFYTRHNQAVYNNWISLNAIRDAMAEGDLSTASEAWHELDEETRNALWLAPSKGGFFSTKERTVIQTKEFREAYYGENNDG